MERIEMMGRIEGMRRINRYSQYIKIFVTTQVHRGKGTKAQSYLAYLLFSFRHVAGN